MSRPGDAPAKPVAREGRERRRTPTVGQWLVFLILAFFLGPLCVSNLWGYVQTRGSLTKAAFRNIRNVAALEASETSEFVRGVANLVPSMVAGNQHLFELLRAMGRPAASAEREGLTVALQAHLAAKAREAKSADEFQVISPSGRLLASSSHGGSRGSAFSATECFARGRQQTSIVGFDYGPEEPAGTEAGHAHGSHAALHSHDARDVHGSGRTAELPEHDHSEPRVLIASPIQDEHGTFLGVFCARFGFGIHEQLMVAHSERTDHARLYLVDENARVVCSSFPDLHAEPYGEILSLLDRLPHESAVASQGRFLNPSGEEILAAYAPVPKLRWGIIVEVPVSQALADLERLKWQAAGASVLLAAVIATAVFFGWRMFVLPLRAMSQTSDRMASGEPGQTVVPRGPREMVDMAAAFNRMSLALRASHEDLESRIAERTRALRESQEFLELLLDSIDQRVVVLGRDGRIIKANRAAIRMHGPDILGKDCCTAFESEATQRSPCPARKTLETGRPASDERPQWTLEGREIFYVETYPIFDAGGELESAVEIARVVTKEKRIQRQMVYQEKMAAFGQLAAGLAHEIGNPLAAIESQLRMAQNDPARADETLGVVRRQVSRMDRMLRELVSFTRRRRDGAMLVSVGQVVEDVIRLVEHDPRASTVTIRKRLTGDLPGVRTQEDQLVQVLLNLGLNALDAMGESGTLTFEMSSEDGWVKIRVRDTGSGVPEHAREHLFEPFFTTKASGRGTGLGLFVSKAIIEEMSGLIELEETGPGGTTFTVGLKADSPSRRAGPLAH